MYQVPICERQDMFVASKLWNEFHKPEDVEPALRQSLTNLGLEYLDLFLMHWPFAFERQHQKTNIIHPVDFSKKVTHYSILKNKTKQPTPLLILSCLCLSSLSTTLRPTSLKLGALWRPQFAKALSSPQGFPISIKTNYRCLLTIARLV